MTEGTQSTHLWLIRHGQAIVNVEPIIGGMRGDTGLTPLGITQAELLRDRLIATREIRPDVFLSSSLPRARQTAGILAVAFPGVSLLLDDDFQELRSGDAADGMDIATYKARYGWISFGEAPLRPVDPGGESWAGFVLRVATALRRITRDHAGKTIVVVCHGGVIDAAFLYFFGMNGLAFPEAGFLTQNTSITRWEHTFAHARMRWRLLVYNDVAHLAPLGRGPAAEGTDYEEEAAEDRPIRPIEDVLPAELDEPT
jgi:probable phosphoglycerate mutase